MAPKPIFQILRRLVARAAAVTVLLLAAVPTHAAGVVFKPAGDSRQEVHSFMRMLKDPSGKMTVADIASGKAGEFKPSAVADRIAFDEAVFWARLDVDLSDYKQPDSYLLFDPHLMGRIEVFFPNADGSFGSTAIDARDPLATQEVAVRSLLFKIPTPISSAPTTLYVRFEQRIHPLQTHMAWVSYKGAIEEISFAQLMQGLLFGALCTLVLYNAFLLFTTRDRAYLLYVYYLSCFTLLMSLITGMKLAWLPFGATAASVVVLNGGVIHGGMWFFRKFLELRRFAPRLDKYLQVVQWCAVGLAVLAVAGAHTLAYQLTIVLITPAMVGIMLSSIVRSRQGFAPARFSVFGLSVHLLVTTAYVMQFAKVIPGAYITIYWVEAAAVWEALCFSFALAYRVRLAEEAAAKLIAEQSRALASEHAALSAVQEATREKNTSLSMISHELRSPLQSILSALELGRLNDPAMSSSPFFRKLTWATERIDSRLRDLFILSVGEAGKLELRPEPFEVRELVDAVLDSVGETAKAKGIELLIRGKQDRIYVVADPRRVEQVLQNLVENAVKYTDAGRVTVTFELVADQILRFQIDDTGVGISAEHQKDLFVPYRRFGAVDRSSTGIGLAVVKKLLMFLGGTVSLTSEVNVGSTFVVEIPVAISHEFDSQLDAQTGRKLLIVDDRREVLVALVEIAHSLGYECDSAESAAVAGNYLAAKPYDVVFIDLDMPVKDGWELASETRRGGGPNADTRLIAISAGTPEGCGIDPQTGVWPFDGFEPKPIERSTLLRLVESNPSQPDDLARNP